MELIHKLYEGELCDLAYRGRPARDDECVVGEVLNDGAAGGAHLIEPFVENRTDELHHIGADDVFRIRR